MTAFGQAVSLSGSVAHAFTIFMALFAMMNPVANVPIFLGLTAGLDRETTSAVATKALVLAFLIVAIFALLGNLIFEVFGLTLTAFRIAGGILLFIIGFNMLHGDLSRVHTPQEEVRERSKEAALGVAVTPLAMPILAGPGTLTTAMSFAAGGTWDILLTIAMFGLLCGITYPLFLFGERVVDYMGEAALGVVTRMMGLLITVMGTQMVIEGVKGVAKMVAGAG